MTGAEAAIRYFDKLCIFECDVALCAFIFHGRHCSAPAYLGREGGSVGHQNNSAIYTIQNTLITQLFPEMFTIHLIAIIAFLSGSQWHQDVS
jgi:hypothetical protein